MTPPSDPSRRFGPFEFDVRSRDLKKRGRRIRLQDQPLLVLETLLERPGELVTREELRQRLWPDGTFVDFDDGLNTAVMRLREALGDVATRPRYIETRPRRGYRFVGTIERAPVAAPFRRFGRWPCFRSRTCRRVQTRRCLPTR